MIAITKTLEKSVSDLYLAYIYRIKYKDEYEREDQVKRDDSCDYLFCRTAVAPDFKNHKFNDKLQESIDLTKREKDKTLRFGLLPLIPIQDQQERDVIYLSGASGGGKTYLLNSIIEFYKARYPNNKVYFITKNNWRQDRSLNKDLYHFVDVEKFIEKYEDEKNVEEFLKDEDKKYSNSFYVFDDIGALEAIGKTAVKTCWSIINIILENKRKAGISIAVISHVPTNYKQTSLLIRETKKYIVFPSSLQVRSDRFLASYLGLSSDQLKVIVNEKGTKWVCIDIPKRAVITQRKMYFLE